MYLLYVISNIQCVLVVVGMRAFVLCLIFVYFILFILIVVIILAFAHVHWLGNEWRNKIENISCETIVSFRLKAFYSNRRHLLKLLFFPQHNQFIKIKRFETESNLFCVCVCVQNYFMRRKNFIWMHLQTLICMHIWNFFCHVKTFWLSFHIFKDKIFINFFKEFHTLEVLIYVNICIHFVEEFFLTF